MPPADPVAFADVLENAAENRSQLKEMGIRAQKLAIREFDRAILSDRFVDWIEDK